MGDLARFSFTCLALAKLAVQRSSCCLKIVCCSSLGFQSRQHSIHKCSLTLHVLRTQLRNHSRKWSVQVGSKPKQSRFQLLSGGARVGHAAHGRTASFPDKRYQNVCTSFAGTHKLDALVRNVLGSVRGGGSFPDGRSVAALDVNIYGAEAHNKWAMTSQTGSYAYMAPEVRPSIFHFGIHPVGMCLHNMWPVCLTYTWALQPHCQIQER